MRGYISQEERQRISASTDKKQKQCSSKNWFYKIELGIIVIITVFSALLIFPCLHDSILNIKGYCSIKSICLHLIYIYIINKYSIDTEQVNIYTIYYLL